MQINQLKRKTKNKKNRIVGRGGKHAKTSGRGGKGQTARAGHKKRPALRDIIKKIPKKRGYNFNSYKEKPLVISLDKIIKFFPKGGTISSNILLQKKIISKKKGLIPNIKILKGKEDFKVKYIFINIILSQKLKEKVIKYGGNVGYPILKLEEKSN